MKTTMIRLCKLMQVLGTNISLQSSDHCCPLVTNIEETARSYLSRIEKKILNEGKARACNHFKQLHTCSVRLATRDTLPEVLFCKTGKDGVPVELNQLKPYLLSSDKNLQRIGLTISRFYEKIVLPIHWDPEPIIAQGPALQTTLTKGFDTFCKEWTARLKIQNIVPPMRTNLMSNLVQGPNGPSILTAHYDASAVLNDPKLFTSLKKLATLVGKEWLFENMIDLGKSIPYNGYRTGRIALLQQGGGKTRTIAIGDYWSQNILRGIHDSLMDILKRMVTDGTYNQESQVDRILHESKGHKAYSYDLSSATDRFPVRMQVILLSHVFTPETAKLWRQVLTSRDYTYKDERVRWKTGQPLGLLSSWAAFALTHHAFIEYCAWLEGNSSFKKYAVLGDDVCIWDEKVAIRYKALIQEMGLTINLGKSLISDDRAHRVEFAKRILLDGHEITGLKWDIINHASNSIYMLIDLISVAQKRSWNLSWSEFLAPPFYTVKQKGLLEILLWDKGEGRRPQSNGVTLSCSPTIEALRRKVVELRIDSLKRKRDSLPEFSQMIPLLEKLLKREGITYSVMSIGFYKNTTRLPVIDTLIQTTDVVNSALEMLTSVLWGGAQTLPDVLPIEYIPMPHVGVYFGQRHRLRSEFHTRIVLKAWFALIKESKEHQSSE